MKIFLKSVLVLFVVLLSFSTLSANKNKHFKDVAKPSKLIIKKGESFEIELTVTMEKGWHIYGFEPKGIDPMALTPTWTEITISQDNIWTLEKISPITKAKTKYDSAFEMNVPVYYGKASFLLKAKANKDIDISKDKLEILIWTQQCTETACLPPEEFKIIVGKTTFISSTEEPKLSQSNIESDSIYASDAMSEVEPSDTLVSGLTTNNETEKSDEIDNQQHLTESQLQAKEMKSRGLLSYIWFAMLQGALALLTPCVFPMIPITVSFFTKRSEKKKSRGLLDSIVYAVGIIFTFTGIGFIFAIIYGPSGIQNLATNPWLNLAIAAIFIIFALNLFGAFEIQLPTGLMNKLNTKSQEGQGITSVLLMGLTFSLTSFTCTVPFVGTTLVSVGSGEWFYPIVGMLAFSLVFAAPFFLLALFPSALNKLPKAGGWMNNIKVIMGFLEIAASIKFLSNADLVWMWGILPRELFLAIWIACLLMIIMYIMGIYKLHHDAPVESIGTPRILFAVFFASITFYLLIGLFGKPLGELDAFLPPPNYEELMSSSSTVITSTAGGLAIYSNESSSNKNEHDELPWFDNYEQALKFAKEKNKKLFIDFTGFTCTNCRWMELNMFTKPQIRSELEDMVLVRLFTDRRQEPYLSNKSFQEKRFNSIELPLYVIYTPDEKLIGTKAFTRDVDEFLNFLRK